MRWREGARLAAAAKSTTFRDRDNEADLSALADGTVLGGSNAELVGRSVLISAASQLAAVVAAVELDGIVSRLALAPPNLSHDDLRAAVKDASIDYVVTDNPTRLQTEIDLSLVPINLPIAKSGSPIERRFDSEWVLFTSGTSGLPKLVAHTLDALTGAIPARSEATERAVWATFYDVRRYGGLQILLRAVLGGADLILTSPEESLIDHFHRLGEAGVTDMSGTPSHWRRVLMSSDRATFNPSYIRLSGEIADQMVLDGLRATFPKSRIGHAFASTEAGVAFAVDDEIEGFPVAFVDQPTNGVELKIVDDSLRIRSPRTASGYVGQQMPLLDADGFVDTGDLVERRGDRYIFIGRRGGIINVGGIKVNPEEVEAIINGHVAVWMSRVTGKKNPLTGAIVVADVVLRDPASEGEALKHEIQSLCQTALGRHKAPALLRFVPSLPLTAAGKLSRDTQAR